MTFISKITDVEHIKQNTNAQTLMTKALERRYIFQRYFIVFLEHLTALEYPEDHQGRKNHKKQGYHPSPCSCSYPSELDIHTKEAGNQGRRHEHQGHKGKHLHDLVLVEVDDTEHSVLQILKSLETEVGVVDK